MSTPDRQAVLEKRIRTAGLVGRGVCTFCLVVCATLLLAWLACIHWAPAWSTEHLAKTAEQTTFYQELADDGGHRALVTAIAVIVGALLLGALHSLRKVFVAAARCQLISAESARELRKLGILLIVVAALRGVDLGLLLCGLIFLLFAWSLEQAAALREEQALTI